MDMINRVAISREDSGYWLDQAEALERLYNNTDFKKVILDGYFTDKAVTGVGILSHDSVKAANARTDVMEGLIAVSALQDHFNTIKELGKSIGAEEDDETIDIDEDK